MRKRNHTVLLRLDDGELAHLQKLVEKSGYSREAYLRSLVSGIVPAERPPPDYHAMMRELHAIGNNLDWQPLTGRNHKVSLPEPYGG